MRVLLDTCIVVDVLQNRKPFASLAQEIFVLCAEKRIEGFLTAKSLTDIFYLTHRQTHSDQATRKILKKLSELFSLLDTTAQDTRRAILSNVADFEDGVMIETALRSKMDCIVTRNTKDYRESQVPVYTPAELLARLTQEAQDDDL